jgi:uncharacterized protein (DUF488 family)
MRAPIAAIGERHHDAFRTVMATGRRIFTVGHGTRSADELVVVLKGAEIEEVADVRRFPGSRRHPHFAREELERWLPDAGIAYSWRGEELGGRRSRGHGSSRHRAWRNAAFQGYADYTDAAAYRAAIEVLERDAEGRRIAVMCAERLWWRCHRRMIADTLELRGTTVLHLIEVGTTQRHPINPAARLAADGWPVYDVGITAALDMDA